MLSMGPTLLSITEERSPKQIVCQNKFFFVNQKNRLIPKSNIGFGETIETLKP